MVNPSSRWLAFALVALFLITGCASKEIGGAVTATDRLAVPDSTSIVTAADLRLSPLDKIKINVFGVADLSGDHQVDQSGRIRVPLIGEVDVKGYTPAELADVLEARYAEKYLNNAEINVILVEKVGDLVTVDGTVKKPGMVPVQGQLSLVQAIALSGGLGEGADARRVMVFRTVEGRRHVAVFNLNDIRRGKTEDPQLFGNDLIVVDGSATSMTYRELLRSLPLIALFTAIP